MYYYINKGSTTALGVVFASLATISITIRFYGLRKYARDVEIDDILIAIASVSRCSLASVKQITAATKVSPRLTGSASQLLVIAGGIAVTIGKRNPFLIIWILSILHPTVCSP